MLDIYTAIDLPLWVVLFVQTTGLPFIQGLVTRAKASKNASRVVTVILSVVASVAMLVAGGSFNPADLFMLAAPGVFISSNAYDKFWQIFRIREYLAPEVGIPLPEAA